MGEDSSNIAPIGLVFLAAMTVLTWCLPRRRAILPLLITICYMPLGQMFVVAGLHFQLLRILLLVGLCRVLSRGENRDLIVTKIDKLFIWWVAITLLMGTMTGSFITKCGTIYDAVGAYFLLRCWMRNTEDLVEILRFAGWMILPLALSMIVEKFTRRNIFAVFGGVSPITELREGTLRCQGAFRHPILAGTYAATLFPFFVGLWFQRGKFRRAAVVGACSATIATCASGSSGALLAAVSALIGFALWPMRHQMRTFRWSLVALIVALAALMQAPVWFLIARVSELFGGTGWHRSYVIDQAIKHFNEWWLVGTAYTAHWAPAGQVLPSDPNNMDITNHYVAEGINGGVLKLGLFMAMIVQGYKIVGAHSRRRSSPVSFQILAWSVGVTLTAHCVSFISISYFDQIVVMWYWLLAILSMLATPTAIAEVQGISMRPATAVPKRQMQRVEAFF
jgi:hypothetical protein